MIRCFAAQAEEPLLSPVPAVQCRVAGHLLPAEGSPCCGDYDKCAIWRKVRSLENEAKVIRDAARSPMKSHVLKGSHDREVVRA